MAPHRRVIDEQSATNSVENESVEECGREPAGGVHARLVLPGGLVVDQTSAADGSLLFELTRDQLAPIGRKFRVELLVDRAAQSVAIAVGE